MAAGSPGEKVEPRNVPAENALQTMLDKWIEDALTGKHLSRILLDPFP